jgi:hypothetical protein
MPFARQDFTAGGIPRYLGLYTKEVGNNPTSLHLTTTDGRLFSLLKTLDVTDTAVAFLVYDEQVGIESSQGGDDPRHKSAVILPFEAIRSVIISPCRADRRVSFDAAVAKQGVMA